MTKKNPLIILQVYRYHILKPWIGDMDIDLGNLMQINRFGNKFQFISNKYNIIH